MVPQIQSKNYAPVNVASVDGERAGGGPAAPGSVATLQPEPKGGDVGFLIAKLVIENSFASRKMARAMRQSNREAMVAAQKAQIAHMRAEADSRFAAAQFSAVGKMADGVLGVAGGMTTAGTFSKKTGAADNGAEGWGAALGSSGKLVGGAFDLIAAGDSHDADLASAAAKADEMEASARKDVIDGLSADMKEAQDHARNALDFLREFQAGQDKAMSAAIKG